MILGFLSFIYIAITMSMICRKMGYPAILGVLTMVPLIGWLLFAGLLWFMAFARWPRWNEDWA